MNTLPILVSIPHGGTKKPPELCGSLCITDRALFDDSDPFAVEIYDLGDKVKCVIKASIARAFVDLNRSAHDVPPQHVDGVIKSYTCYRKPIYIRGMEPNNSTSKTLIDTYYVPYHELIQKNINCLDLQLCLDCHTMASVTPNMSGDPLGNRRPAFCLSDWDGRTSSPGTMSLLAECIADCFSVDPSEISMNDPFHGGHITKTYGNNPIPWIQIEMNRDLYLSEEWFDSEAMTVDRRRLLELNQMFARTLSEFCRRGLP